MVGGEEGFSNEGRNWVVYILNFARSADQVGQQVSVKCGRWGHHDAYFSTRVARRSNTSFRRGNYYTEYGFQSSHHLESVFVWFALIVVRWRLTLPSSGF